MMKRLSGAALAAMLLLSGCVSDGMTPAQVVAVQNANDQNLALARAHKITFAEAARRANEAAVAASGGQLSDNQSRINAYRAAVYSMVDAGQISPEVAEYQVREREAALAESKRQQRAAALASVGQGLQAASESIRASQAAQSANRPITCMTPSTYGTPLATVTTTCQ